MGSARDSSRSAYRKLLRSRSPVRGNGWYGAHCSLFDLLEPCFWPLRGICPSMRLHVQVTAAKWGEDNFRIALVLNRTRVLAEQ